MQLPTALAVSGLRASSVTGRARRAFDTVRRFLFGHDVFISYARADALEYAQTLADQLTRQNVATFVDQLGAPPGPQLPPALLLQLRLSSMLVLVASPGASASTNVAREVEEYLRHNNRLFVVDVAGALEGTPWYSERISGGPARRITPAELEAGVPSEAVVEQILRKMAFTRREERLRRTLRLILAGIVALLLGGAAAGTAVWAQAGKWQDDARQARAGLAVLQDSARAARQEALQARAAADGALTAASESRRRSALADSNRLAAEAGARRANEDASAARERVAGLEKVQEALSLAGRSIAVLDTTAAGVTESLLLAVESLREAWTPQGAGAWLRAMARVSRPLTIQPAHAARVSAVAVPADGARVASGAEDGTVLVWRVNEADGQASLVPAFPSGIQGTAARGVITSLAFSPDGSVLAVRSGALLELWDVAGPAPALRVSRTFPGFIHDLEFSGNGRVLAAVASDRVELIGSRDGEVTELQAGAGSRRAVFSPDGRVLALGGEVYDERGNQAPWLQLWDLEAGARLDSVAVAPMDDLSFTADGEIAASTQRWTIERTDGPTILSAPAPADSLRDAFPLGARLLPGAVVISTGRGMDLTFLMDAMVTEWDPREHWVVAGGSDGSVALLGTEPRSETLRLPSPGFGSISLSGDGLWLAMTREGPGPGERLRVVEVRTGREVMRDTSALQRVGFTRDNRWLVVEAGDDVRTYSTQGWREGPALPDGESVLISPSDGQVAIYPSNECEPGEAGIWDVASGTRVDACRAVVWSDAGDLDSGTAWSRLGEPEGWAEGLAVSGGHQLRDPDTGREIAAMQWPFVTESYSSGGEWLAVGDGGRQVLLWRVGRGDAMIGEACERLARNLSPVEWRRVFPYQPYRASCPGLRVPPDEAEEQ